MVSDQIREDAIHNIHNSPININGLPGKNQCVKINARLFAAIPGTVSFDKTLNCVSYIRSKSNLTDNISRKQNDPDKRAWILMDTNFKKGD